MNRLYIKSRDTAQKTVEGLYKDLERRIAASPPGQCPVDLASSFLKLCHSQSCGKCTPCRVGLGQLQMMIDDILEMNTEPGLETLELLEKSGVPFAAPSANPSGEPSPKNADSVLKYFDVKIDAVLDGGECGIGCESTLIDLSRTPYRILRQGALPADEIADAFVDSMKIIGITGGTGCGKTTALNELERRGALLIDCDAVYHRMLETDRPMLDEIEKYFTGAVIDGKLDRKALGAVVFTDEEALRDLNIITHRHINLEIRRILREHAMNGGTLAAIDAIELFSSGLAKRCTATIGVIADREVRIDRIMRRDGISREYAMMRVNAQRPNEYFIQKCSHVLENNGSQEEFIEKCRKTFEEVL